MKGTTHPANVFDRSYLEHLSHRDPRGSSYAEAEYAGPWTVQEREGGFAVEREAEVDQGEPDAVFVDRETALLVAAISPTLGRDPHFQLAPSTTAAGFDVRTLVAGQVESVGWLRHDHPEVVEALNVVEWLLRSPASLAKVIEAAGYSVLVHAEKYLELSLDADAEGTVYGSEPG